MLASLLFFSTFLLLHTYAVKAQRLRQFLGADVSRQVFIDEVVVTAFSRNVKMYTSPRSPTAMTGPIVGSLAVLERDATDSI